MNNTRLLFGGLILGFLFTVASCSKDKNGGSLTSDSSISMSIDGKPWKSKMAYVLTANEDDEDHVVVMLTGTEVNLSEDKMNSDKDAEGLTIHLAIPKSKFENPKGAYPFISEANKTEVGQAVAIFITMADNITSYYGSMTGESGGGATGSITIDDFKVGDQKFLGQSLGKGYTQLSGTFSMDLMTAIADGEGGFTGKKLKITNGKFNVKAGVFGSSILGQANKDKLKLQLKK